MDLHRPEYKYEMLLLLEYLARTFKSLLLCIVQVLGHILIDSFVAI